MRFFIPRALRLFALAAGSFAASLAAAQTAPEGNAHPQAQVVSKGDARATNPFGSPARDTLPATIEQKAALAAAVDLSPLRDLSVYHDGRVKIVDTLARETVLRLTGQRAYTDLVPDGLKFKKLKYDSLFTLLDLIIEPRYYMDKPLLGIDYLPLRRIFVKAQFPNDEAAQKSTLQLLRLSPGTVATFGQEIMDKYRDDPAFSRAFGHLDDSIKLWQGSAGNLLMVPPASRDDAWTHLSLLPAEHPARKAALDLGAAWRVHDAAAVNAAVKLLAAVLPKINETIYPTSARTLEIAYNRANAFEWGFYAYFLSLITLLLAFGTSRSWLAWLGSGFLVASVALHGFGFVSRCIIAERFAIQNQFESMTGLSLFAALAGLGIMLAKRQWLYGAAAAAVGFLVLITATQTNIPGQTIEREAAILNTSILLKYHVTTVLVSYGLISLGFVVSLFYLGAYYFGGRLQSQDQVSLAATALGTVDTTHAGIRERMLADLDTAQMTVLQLAFWGLGVGILLGAWWADHSWGRWWGFDSKETWALITWIIYLITIHVRMTTGRNRALVTAWLSVLGFILMLWTYFGVNLLLPGLHAYA